MPNKKLETLVYLISDYWVQISICFSVCLLVVCQLLVTNDGVQFFSDDLAIQRKIKIVALISLFVLLAVQLTISIIDIFKKNRLSNLERENEQLRGEREAVLNDLRAVIKGYLYGIVEHLKFGSVLGISERITIYSHDEKAKCFVPIGRISLNPIFDKHGRTSYPDDQGFIAKAWTEGHCYRNLPSWETNNDEYIKIGKEVNFPKSLHKNLRMKSRCYFGWRITNAKNEHLAVIIVESTQMNRWTEESLLNYFDLEKKKLSNIFERIYPYIPELSEARERGF